MGMSNSSPSQTFTNAAGTMIVAIHPEAGVAYLATGSFSGVELTIEQAQTIIAENNLVAGRLGYCIG